MLLSSFMLGMVVDLPSVLSLILDVVIVVAGLKTDAVDAAVVSPSESAPVCRAPFAPPSLLSSLPVMVLPDSVG